ncbi:DUF4190 domain-containing protein [Micromonospora peucetia]|uniref:DUF4190 domain-containing protein n=1 Tax=Micromonospora peucetia TaxID=47871 RepID=A0A1C6W6M3_9ACTN|nr:DUF4190 domain-containing protein [Micromonospora peucetia]WSA33122.1 DUF4190 domain-containing protein [Micromonospora peucetia]SCL46783.1 protein of unknown function (DUF4190) [Micromonospora peucetia]SCL74131.1 protein of unknown function (DUF4190) [Micromonospora peucetia]
MTYPQPGPPYGPPPISGPPTSPGYPPAGYYPPPQVIVAQVPPASGLATASMVLGIIGVLGGWCLFGLPCLAAVVLGHMGLRDTADGRKSGRGMAVAGLVLGYVFVAPMIVFTVMIFMGGVMGAVSPTPTATP